MELILLVVIGTSIWVFVDAPARGLSWTWGLGCLALWIVAFPWYLAVRGRQKQVPVPSSGWYPDPRDPERYERRREGTRWTGDIRERRR